MASTYIRLPIHLTALGPNGIIDDAVTVTNKTWSSSKIASEISSIGDTFVRSTRFESISSGTSGSLTLTGTQAIILDDFGGTTDAIVSTIEGSRPTNFAAEDAQGDIIAVTLDGSGNWTFTNTPISYPVAIIFRTREKLSEYDDTNSGVVGGVDFLITEKNAVIVYDDVISVASGSTTTIISYSANDGEKLTRVLVSGTNIATYTVRLNGTIIARKRTNFGDNPDGEFEFSPGVPIVSGDTVLVQVLHDRPMSGDFDTSLILET